MGLPTPNPQQIASMTALKELADAGAAGADESIAAIQSAIDVQQDAEDFQKSMFDTINDLIIRNYEMEVRWLNGNLLEDPIVEADLQSFSEKDTGSRIWNSGQYVPARISQFDGTPLTYQDDDQNEVKQFQLQDIVIDRLKNGIAGQILLESGATISTPITPASTSLTIQDNTNPISPNDILLILSGTDAAVIKVLTSSPGGFCTGETTPPQLTEPACTGDGGTWTNSDSVTFEYLIEPTGTIPAGTPIGQDTWTGFTNAERTAKTATNPDFQPILTSLLYELMTVLNDRKNILTDEIQVIQNNENDDIAPTAETHAQDSLTAVNGFLGISAPTTIDISDTGLDAIDDEKAIRSPQVSARVTAIAAEIAAGDFYNKRFDSASGRAHLANGSITLLRELNEGKAAKQAGKSLAQGLSTRYAGLIP